MDIEQAIGIDGYGQHLEPERQKLHLYINLKLASCGQPTCTRDESAGFMVTAHDMLRSYREKSRQLSSSHYPSDQRIQNFLQAYCSDLNIDACLALPTMTFELDRHGIARELSLPVGEDEFHSDVVSSFRLKQGVLHNPANDRRTTKGSFHIADGGLPVPGDKKEVPKLTFARMLEHALDPPEDLLIVPWPG